MARTKEEIEEAIAIIDEELHDSFDDVRELNAERAELVKELAGVE